MRWFLLFALVAAGDLGVRCLIPFSMPTVLWTETFLFLAAAVATRALARSSDEPNRRRGLGPQLAAAFLALGARRAGVWATGAPVFVANMSAHGLAVLAAALAVWKRRRCCRNVGILRG
jgi:hypothetical protein